MDVWIKFQFYFYFIFGLRPRKNPNLRKFIYILFLTFSFSIFAEQPTTALNYFNQAVAFHKQSDFEKALANYDKVIEMKSPLAPMALYYKAKIYERQGDISNAKLAVQSISLNTVPENMRKTVLAYKNKLFALDAKDLTTDTGLVEDSAAAEKNLFLYIDLQTGSNSNPTSTSNSSVSSITTDTETQFKAGADYQVDYNSDYDLKVNYLYAQSTYKEQTTLNYKYHNITLPISYYIDSFKFKLTPEFFADTYDTSSFSEQRGISLDSIYKIEDTYINFLLQTNRITNKTTTYSYLTGSQNKAQIGIQQRWATSKISSKLYISDYHYTDTTTLGSSYKAYGINFSYSKYFDNFDISASAVYEIKKYIFASADTVARTDARTYVAAQIGFDFYSYYRLYLDASTTVNTSNFDTTANDKNYKQNLFSVGAAWNY